jgi:hypothetical protein
MEALTSRQGASLSAGSRIFHTIGLLTFPNQKV